MLDALKMAATLNAPGFIAAANDLGADVASVEDAAIFFASTAETEGESFVIEILREIPVANDGLNGSFNFTEKRSGMNTRSWVANLGSNLGDAVITLLGGAPSSEMELLQQNAALQQQAAAAAAAAADETKIPLWVWLLIGAAAVGGIYYVMRES